MIATATILLEHPEVDVPDALRFLGRELMVDSDHALDDVSNELIKLYKQEIEAVGAVDTRFMLDTVELRSTAWLDRTVASRAFYSGLVEFGWTTRSGDPYPGRYPAQRALDRLEVEDAFDRALRR